MRGRIYDRNLPSAGVMFPCNTGRTIYVTYVPGINCYACDKKAPMKPKGTNLEPVPYRTLDKAHRSERRFARRAKLDRARARREINGGPRGTNLEPKPSRTRYNVHRSERRFARRAKLDRARAQREINGGPRGTNLEPIPHRTLDKAHRSERRFARRAKLDRARARREINGGPTRTRTWDQWIMSPLL